MNSPTSFKSTSNQSKFAASVQTRIRTPNRALVIEHSGPQLVDQDLGEVGEQEVLVQIESLGLCRTDLRVYQGKIDAALPRIPGHEFSGIVAETGANVSQVASGDHVVINPVLPCGNCEFCADGQCQNSRFLGLDLDGACSQFCKLPSSSVHKIPASLPFDIAAFAEPVAASLAVLNAEIKPEQRGLLLGDSRIAILTQRILRAHDFSNVQMVSVEQLANLTAHSFDFAIETFATTETVKGLARCLCPNGLLIFKSRQQVPIQLNLAELLPKNIRFQCVNYGLFDSAIDLLVTGKVAVNDLIGPTFGIDEYAYAFERAIEDESSKVFIRPQISSLVGGGDL